MSAYLKGGIVAVLVSGLIFLIYRAYEDRLPANRSPEGFQVISKMESEGVRDFTLERLDGSKVTLSQYKGKIIIVNFWASWCNPCVEEFPSMVKLAEKMNGNVVIFAVSIDEQKSDVEAFAKLFGLPKPGFEILWDRDKKVMESYGVQSKVPESFIVRTDFKLARKVLGIENWASEDALMYFRSLLSGKH